MLADIVVIAVIAVFAVNGCRKGFMKSLMGLVSFVLSLIVAFIIYPMVSGILFSTPVYDWALDIAGKGNILEYVQNADGKLFELLSGYMSEGTELTVGNLPEVLAGIMINVISFILVLIISRIVIWVLIRTLNIIVKLPVVRQFNKLGGGIIGGVTGVLVLYIVFAVAVIFVPLEENGKISQSVEESKIAKTIYENNFVLNLIDKGEAEL